MEYGRKHGLPYSIIRPTGVYGPRAVYGGGQMLMEPAGMNPVAIPANFDTHVPLIHVRDVAKAALFLAERPETNGEIFNVNDDTIITMVEFMEFIAESTGHKFFKLPPVPVQLMRGVMMQVARMMQFASRYTGMAPKLEADTVAYLGNEFLYSNQKLKDTGFAFLYPDAREGIRETLEWYKHEGWIDY